MKRTIAVRDAEEDGLLGTAEKDGPEQKRVKKEAGDMDVVLELTGDDFECVICCDLMVDPVVSRCGHDFCRFCLDMVMDSAHKRHAVPSCPVCRTTLARIGANHELSVCIKLKELIERLFPHRSRQRRTEVEREREREKVKAEAEAAQRRAARSAAAAAAAAAGGAGGMQFGLPRGLLDDLSFSRHMLDMIQRSHQRAFPGPPAGPGVQAGPAAAAAAARGGPSLAANAAAAAAAAAAASSASREALQELRQRASRRVESLRAAESLAPEGSSGAAAAAAAAAVQAGYEPDRLAEGHLHFMRNVPTGSRSARGRPDPAAVGAGAAAPTHGPQRQGTAAAAAAAPAARDRQRGRGHRDALAADEAGAIQSAAAAAAAQLEADHTYIDLFELHHGMDDRFLPAGERARLEAYLNPPHQRRLGRDPAAAAAAAAAGTAAGSLGRAAPAQDGPASPPAAAAAAAAAGADAPPAASTGAAAAAAPVTHDEEARHRPVSQADLGGEHWQENVPRQRHATAAQQPSAPGPIARTLDSPMLFDAVGDWDPAAAAAAGAGSEAAAAAAGAAAAAAGAGVSSSPAGRLAGLAAARHAQGSPGSRSLAGPPLFRPAAAADAVGGEDEADSGSRQQPVGRGVADRGRARAGSGGRQARGMARYGLPFPTRRLPDRADREAADSQGGSRHPWRARRFGMLAEDPTGVQQPQPHLPLGLGGGGLRGRQAAAAAGRDVLPSLLEEADSLLASLRRGGHRPAGQAAALSPAARNILEGLAGDVADAVADAAAADDHPATAAAAAAAESPEAAGSAERHRRVQLSVGRDLRVPVVGEGQDVRQHAAAVTAAAAAAAAAPRIRHARMRDAPYAGHMHRSHTNPAAAAAAEAGAPAALPQSRRIALQLPHAVGGARVAPAAAAAAAGSATAAGVEVAAGAGQAPSSREGEPTGNAQAVADPPAAVWAAPPAAGSIWNAYRAAVRDLDLIGPVAGADAPLAAAAAAAGADSSDEATEHLAAPEEWQVPGLPLAGTAPPEGSIRGAAAAAAAGGGLSGRQTARSGGGWASVRRGQPGQQPASRQQDRGLGRSWWLPEESDSDNGQQAGEGEGGALGRAGAGTQGARRTAAAYVAAGSAAAAAGPAAGEAGASAPARLTPRARNRSHRTALAPPTWTDRRVGLGRVPRARQAAAAPADAAVMVEDGGYISSD